jgi:hypothetical protein
MRLASGFLLCAALLATATTGDQASAMGLATYTAAIRNDGFTNYGSGIASSVRIGLGTYEVTFNRAVQQCVYMATTRGNQPGLVSTINKGGTPDAIVVRTFTHAGAKADLSFYLMVYCNN